jgi:nucleotide-binding universal stress UspA family protein
MNVLFGDDGSAHARLAEALLLKLPGIRESEVTVLSVAPPPMPLMVAQPGLGAPVPSVDTVDLWREFRAHATTVAEAAKGRLEAAGVSARALVTEGYPADEIISQTDQNPFDLVIVGSKGETALEGLLLGSVTRKLITHSRCSVLVARPFAGMSLDQSTARLNATERLSALASVDDSPESHRVVRWLLGRGHNAFRRILTLTVAPLMPVPPTLDPATVIELLPADVRAAEALAEATAENLRDAADEVKAVGKPGRPPSTIIEVAKEEGVDLIVMGATRHGALERFLLGSTSHEVAVHAPCSVLVLRDPA